MNGEANTMRNSLTEFGMVMGMVKGDKVESVPVGKELAGS